MRRYLPYIVFLLPTMTFVAFQCESDVRGRVIAVNGKQVIVFFTDPDSVRVGEEFSLWRDRQVAGSIETFRTGIINITELFSPDSAEAILTYGKAEEGDKVTKWMVSEGK